MEISKEIYEYKKEIFDAENLEQLYQVWVKYLGKKGLISLLNKELKNVTEDKRSEFGRIIVGLREEFEKLYKVREDELKKAEINAKIEKERIDVTLPSFPLNYGGLHPITQVYFEIVEIFKSMGYELATGPEIELDFYNFEALNIPKEHPARDMQDTFYIDDEVLLRTHTSPVQIRTMEMKEPPIKIIAPGKVYRCDSDVTHTPMFHQVEGLLIDTDTTFGDLKGALTTFIHRLFGKDIPVRFRPSFFPFTEPSAEVDMGCVICGGKGCRVCKGTGWLEILGSGMVHPKVLESVGYDSEKYRGFAFGMGIERITMLKFGIDDLRLFFDNNIKFLRQF